MKKVIDIEKKLPSIKKRLGEMLIDAGLIDEKVLADALEVQKIQDKKLGDILIGMGVVDDTHIADVLAKQFGAQYIRLEKLKLDKAALKTIPIELANKYCVMPLQVLKKNLVVAMANPLDYNAIQDIQFISQRSLYTAVAPASDIRKAIERYYPDKDLKDELLSSESEKEYMEIIQATKEEEEESQIDLATLADNAPVIRFTNATIADAVRLRASDIHIEPQIDDKGKPNLTVRYRIDGIMHEKIRTDRHIHPPLVSRIKIISGLDISERRKPQDGKAQVKFENEKYDLRISTIPTTYGEKVTIRILNPASARMSPKDLGFSEKDLTTLMEIISHPQGIILVTGPTGSGKSSTLYACLNHLNSPSVNIITVEDPVEFDVAGINQVQINVQAGITFAAGLRSILRQDPDIVLVGEIRDSETAGIAFQAAQTGHLVLSTLHTNDAPSAVTRLLDLGIDDFQISAALLAAIGQRLVRKVHPECKANDTIGEKTMERIRMLLDTDQEIQFWKGAGCNDCQSTGYWGRMGIYEILVATPGLKELIKPHVPAAEIKNAAIREGFNPMTVDGLTKALQGLTTVEEVFRVAPPEIDSVDRQRLKGKPKPPDTIIAKPAIPKGPPLPDDSQGETIPAFAEEIPEAMEDRAYSVLVVDDEEITRMIICDALESKGFNTATAEDGIEALEAVKKEKPDMIVVDYIMPRMNGINLIKALKADSSTSDIPIIMLTSIDEVDSEVMVLKAGADDYITKPVNRDRFLIRAEKLLRRKL